MTTLPKIEDYKAPWEVDSEGNPIPDEDQKVEGSRLKKYLHGLLSDKARLQETVTTITGERDTLKTAADDRAREGEDDAAKQKREHAEALKAAEARGGLSTLALEVALDVEGITPAQARTLAKRLTGTDRESLEADAKAIADDFGIGKQVAQENAEGDDAGKPPVGRPRRARAAGDPDPDAKTLPDATDRDAVLKAFPRH